MTDSLARSLTTKFKRQAIAVLMAGVSFAALAGLAQATTVPVYTANLDTNPMWGGSPGSPTTLDQITQNWGAAVMNGLVVSNSSGLGLRDFYNPGSPGSFTPSVVTPANTFAFEYTFTVGSSANPQGSFVTSFGGRLISASPSIKGLRRCSRRLRTPAPTPKVPAPLRWTWEFSARRVPRRGNMFCNWLT